MDGKAHALLNQSIPSQPPQAASYRNVREAVGLFLGLWVAALATTGAMPK